MDHGSLPHRDGHSHLLNPRFQRVADSMGPLFSTTRDPGRWLRSPVPLASAAAFATTLPRLDLELEPTSQLRGHVTPPRFGLPKNRVCQAALVVARAAPQAHLRGRRRQAVRTNLRRAADHRLTVGLTPTPSERVSLEAEVSARIPGMAAWSHLMHLRPGDAWWGVFAGDGHPLGVGVVSLAQRVAILRTLVVDLDHDAGRYAQHLLHAEIVGAVAESGCDVLLVDGPHIL